MIFSLFLLGFGREKKKIIKSSIFFPPPTLFLPAANVIVHDKVVVVVVVVLETKFVIFVLQSPCSLSSIVSPKDFE